ncbi:MAG: GNAT family N-acetyltransferase [Candidatus Saccharibacteria bacterium]
MVLVAKALNFIVDRAKPHELEQVMSLLSICSLTAVGMDMHFETYWVVRDKGRIIGSVGLEVYENSGMLRSFAVHPEYRNHGIGRALAQALLEYAKSIGLKKVFLLTKTAPLYFARLGFEAIDESQVEPAVSDSLLFKEVCCEHEVIMVRGTEAIQ